MIEPGANLGSLDVSLHTVVNLTTWLLNHGN